MFDGEAGSFRAVAANYPAVAHRAAALTVESLRHRPSLN